MIINSKGAIGVHHTGVDTSSSWDASQALKNLGDSPSAAQLRDLHAWVDPQKDATTKGAYKLPHHDVSSSGRVGDANMKGVASAMGRLNGGGLQIPEADRQGVYDHLKAHYADAGMDAPELKSMEISPAQTKRKEFRVSVKEMNVGEDGKGQVVFATLGVVDKDGDITDKGAFGNQLAHLMPMHVWKDADSPFLGVASIKESGNEAIADIELNMDLQRAKDWRSSMKFALDRGKTIEWSYGFDVTDSEIRTVNGKKVRALKSLIVHEVSPVVIGAGENTRVLSMKAYAEMQGTWEAIQSAIMDAAEALLIGDQDGFVSIEGTYPDRVVVCAYVYGMDSTDMTYYQFNWTMRNDGTVELSNQQEVALSVVVANKNLKFSDQFARVLGELQSLTQRQKALAALKAEQGRPLSQANRDRVSRLIKELNQFLESSTAATPNDGEIDPNLPNQLLAQFLQIETLRAGHIGGSNA
jgi:prohead serine protease